MSDENADKPLTVFGMQVHTSPTMPDDAIDIVSAGKRTRFKFEQSNTDRAQVAALGAVEKQPISHLLKARRESLGLSQKKAGEALGVHELTYGYWERGTNTPGLYYRYDLARWLDEDIRVVGAACETQSLIRLAVRGGSS